MKSFADLGVHAAVADALAARSIETPFAIQSLVHPGRALSFPCDAAGHVDMDALSERERTSYLYARAVIGREFSRPRRQQSE